MILSTSVSFAEIFEDCESIHYYDLNDDNVADFEYHHNSCFSNSGWKLIDMDYDGRYDLKIYDRGHREDVEVDLPAPKLKETGED